VLIGSQKKVLPNVTHGKKITKNSVLHQGSAGKMEVDAMKEMFMRSSQLLGVKYENYIGDGDTKTFKAIQDLNPYDDVTVKKLECVGHVQKRLGTSSSKKKYKRYRWQRRWKTN